MRFVVFAVILSGCPSPTATSSATDSDADTDKNVDTDADVDQDGDGVSARTDCDDADPRTFPGAAERCDGADNDCDGHTPRGELDRDGDGSLDCEACEAAGWYDDVIGLEGAALEAKITELVAPHYCNDYSAARIYMFDELDPDPMTGLLTCVYTGVTATPDGTTTPGNFNTEHTWPQSQGASSTPARCDLHHLYPSEAEANSRRGSYPFGEVVSATWTGGESRLGTDASGATVFEPPDAHKGNVARSLLYFGLQYGYTLEPSYHNLLRQWAEADPVDAREVARSLKIADEQRVANPLVVCGFVVEKL